MSPRLAAAPPMPSSVRCSEAIPEDLEGRLRFYARQIKSLRTTSLLYSSPELIWQIEGDYETALLLNSPRQVYSLLQSFRRGTWAGCLHDQPGMTPDPKSASTSSTRRRGHRKRGASDQFIEGLCDASAPAHATEGPANASAPAPSLQAFQGFSEKLVLVLASEPCDEGFEEEALLDPVSEGFKEQLVLILVSEPIDEGFEVEAPSNPVPEGFKEQFVLMAPLLPLRVRQVFASASEGSPGLRFCL
ncbi:hypothetical protein CRENBAI_017761 [Crenichthys baileyi]|uniref:Uncharacterized protein n=1 Tax=Crenichthys baileyi TaxID=28760 RepID=A0AAV9R041_9TELE